LSSQPLPHQLSQPLADRGQAVVVVDANVAGVYPDIPHSLWLFLSEMKVLGLHPLHPRLVPRRWS